MAKVNTNAPRKVDELERRFTHSDEIFETRVSRPERLADEHMERGAADKEMKYDHRHEACRLGHCEGGQIDERNGRREWWKTYCE